MAGHFQSGRVILYWRGGNGEQLQPPDPFKNIFGNVTPFFDKKTIEEVQISSESYSSAVEIDEPSRVIN